MKVKADLHNHLRTSSNLQQRDFNLAIDTARQRLDENGIFALVNFADRRYEQFIGLPGYERIYLGDKKQGVYVPEKRVLVVKGEEIGTRQGHLLVLGLGYKQHLKQGRSLEDTLKEAKEQRSICIADHAFSHNGIGSYLEANPELIRELDALEVHNGETLPKANKRALDFYLSQLLTKNYIGALASSDGHSFYELGRSWTRINFPEPSNQFIENLRRSILNAGEGTDMRLHTSYIGMIDHIADLLFILNIAPKIGLAHLFETDRPNNN